MKEKTLKFNIGLGLRCLTPLSTIFQLYREDTKGSKSKAKQ
jgi:hypothetical protein